MEGKQPKSQPPFKALAKARLRELRATTKATARALGLPPEAEPAVLATIYGGDPVPAVDTPAVVASSASIATSQMAASGEDVNLRRRLHHLVDGFVRAHFRERTEEFAALWEAFASTPLEGIGRVLGSHQSASAGLGFATNDEELSRIVAVAAWALTGQPSQESILREAERQGLPRARRHALAAYLVSHLDDI